MAINAINVKALGFNSNLIWHIATLSPVISAFEFASDTSGFVYVWRAILPSLSARQA
jgi:hypothetical protein